MAQMLKETSDPDIAIRAQKALDEAVEAAGKSSAHLNCLRARLEFLSTDSEAGSFLGNQHVRQEGMREDQARGQERGGQERGEPGRPQCEPGQDEENGGAPDSSDFFSGRD
jgi:hypothetical protein